MDGKRGLAQPFPENFRFGVATADHQCEAYLPEYEDVTDVWEKASNKVLRGKATDFWMRYSEDVALAQSLGCTAFRFSLSWARLEPRPGQYNQAAFDHYHELIAAVRAANMEPIVTIVHFAWPLHVEERGGLISPEFPAIFTPYVTKIAAEFGQKVRYWIPFNEPTIMTTGYLNFGGGTNYNLPPGFPEGTTIPEQLEAVAALIRNLFLAHTAARQALKRVNPAAQIGSNPNGLGLPNWLQKWLDRNVMRLRNREDMLNQAKRYVARPLLEKGKVDLVLANLTRTREREQEVAFSDTYFVAGQTLLVLAQSQVLTVRDLEGKAVGVVRTSTAQRNLSALIPGALARVFGTYEAAISELDQGTVEAILADNVILQGWSGRAPRKYRLTGGLLTNEPYAAAVALGNYELRDVVNLALQQFKDSGEWQASYEKHFPRQPVPEIPIGGAQTLAALRGQDAVQATARRLNVQDGKLPLAAAGTALRRIQDRGYIVIAVKTDVPGLSYCDPTTKEYSGLEIDLARKIALLISGDADHIRFQPATTPERIPLLRSLVRFLDPLVNLYNLLTTWLNSNWWHLGMAGKLPEFMCPPECVGQQDFIGLDYYWGISSLRLHRIRRLMNAYITGRDMTQAPVWPGGMYNALKFCANLFPGQPIMVVENGCIEQADGVTRADYLRQHIQQVQRAINDGMSVIGYVCWCITSNREWGAKFDGTSDYGLFYIDLDNDPELERISTPAAKTYREIIRSRGI